MAAVVTDVSHARTPAAAVTLTASHTVTAGANLRLYVGVAMWNAFATQPQGVTYGGVALTLINIASYSSIWLGWYVLDNPTVGTANVVMTAPAGLSHSMAFGAYTVSGVPGASWRAGTTGAAGNSTTPSVNIPSLTTDLVLDFTVDYVYNITRTPGAGQTSLFQEDSVLGTDFHGAGSSEVGGASTTTMSWTMSTSGNWGITALAVPSVDIPVDVLVSQMVVETVTLIDQDIRISQLVVEAVLVLPQPIRISQVVLETVTPFDGSGGGVGGAGVGAMVWTE